MSSVKFPEGFIAIKNSPGYFWHTFDKQLYSIKSGILTPLKVNQGRYPAWLRNIGRHYQLSVGGQRKYISLKEIDKHLVEGEYVIPQQILESRIYEY